MQPNSSRQRSGSNVVRAAERREKVVERVFVRDINRRQLQADLVSIPVEEVVMSDSEIEQVSRRHARRIGVVVFSAWRRYLHQP